MQIADNIIKHALSNVYFIWGSGKTTTANALGQKHGFYVYHTDNSRSRHFKNAHPDYQPAMCRNVHDFWALEKDDALSEVSVPCRFRSADAGVREKRKPVSRA